MQGLAWASFLAARWVGWTSSVRSWRRTPSMAKGSCSPRPMTLWPLPSPSALTVRTYCRSAGHRRLSGKAKLPWFGIGTEQVRH